MSERACASERVSVLSECVQESERVCSLVRRCVQEHERV